MANNDLATARDQLGFTPFVSGVSNLIKNLPNEELPATIGVFGAWGSGKSSFMMQLRRQLELPHIWFEAWKYDQTDDVRSALIFKILDALRRESPPGVRARIARAMKGGAKLSYAPTRSAVGSVTHLDMPSADQLSSIVSNERKTISAVDAFSDEYEAAVIAYLEAVNASRLVVFIDDLDRCLPENECAYWSL